MAFYKLKNLCSEDSPERISFIPIAGKTGLFLTSIQSYLSADKPFFFPHITVCELHIAVRALTEITR